MSHCVCSSREDTPGPCLPEHPVSHTNTVSKDYAPTVCAVPSPQEHTSGPAVICVGESVNVVSKGFGVRTGCGRPLPFRGNELSGPQPSPRKKKAGVMPSVLWVSGMLARFWKRSSRGPSPRPQPQSSMKASGPSDTLLLQAHPSLSPAWAEMSVHTSLITSQSSLRRGASPPGSLLGGPLPFPPGPWNFSLGERVPVCPSKPVESSTDRTESCTLSPANSSPAIRSPEQAQHPIVMSGQEHSFHGNGSPSSEDW